MIDAMLANDPMLSTEAAEPMLPMLSTDPTDPIDRNELVDPMLRAELRERSEPRVPGHGTRVAPLSREVTCPRLRSQSQHPALRRPPGRSDGRALDRWGSERPVYTGLDPWRSGPSWSRASRAARRTSSPCRRSSRTPASGHWPSTPGAVPVGRLRRAVRLRRRPARRGCP